MLLAAEMISRASWPVVLLRATVLIGIVLALYYVFGVWLPRRTARRCPECRTILEREETDQWRNKGVAGGVTIPAARLVRFKCPGCGYKDEKWVKAETVMARPADVSDHITQAEIEQGFWGPARRDVQRNLDRLRERQDQDPRRG
ncbi:MAG: hypothetical protein C4551_07590 [Bacillota bacterium]|nr:MAG: hypothetical protein C4551_07590 [Bacillota bacterium]